MIENTAKALKYYRALLTKNNLEEGKDYEAKFTFKAYCDTYEITKVKCYINFDNFELSPMIVFECFAKDEYAGTFGIAEPKYILDKYDREAIMDTIEDMNNHDYNVKLFKKILDKIKIKEVENERSI